MQDTRARGHSKISKRLYVAQNIDILSFGKFFRFFRPKVGLSSLDSNESDFGPVNMANILLFVKSLDAELLSYPESNIVFCVEKGRRNFTNAVLLLGSYMILRENLTTGQVLNQFARLDTSLLVPYRTSKCLDRIFDLTLSDCWHALENGKIRGWVGFSLSPTIWGKINLAFYRNYASSTNGNMHQVVPGEVVAFKGPVSMGSKYFRDPPCGERCFSPSFHAEVFSEIGVTDIVRLGEHRYHASAFTSLGFRHHDLFYADEIFPPEAVVTAFFHIIDKAEGAIAVHCDDGLGRTGTLISLHLMRSHGFTAPEAIAWLRIMRPGSVIGEQQHYLCEVDEILCEMASQDIPEWSNVLHR